MSEVIIQSQYPNLASQLVLKFDSVRFLQIKQAVNVERRTWDRDAYAKKAEERLLREERVKTKKQTSKQASKH